MSETRFSLDARGHSEVGLVRKNNQDSAYVSGRLLGVADGMGGAAAGDMASAIAVRRLEEADKSPQNAQNLTEFLNNAIEEANDDIAAQVWHDPRLDGMGTTVCAMLFDGHNFGLASIGDSRGYLYRDGELTQLTHDHSWVQLLVDEGKLTPEEAAIHPNRSLVLKVVNGTPNHIPDLSVHEAKLGDRLLLCSDGLCGMISANHIAELLAEPDLNDVVARLSGAALDAGGHDNITIVVADVVPENEVLDTAPAQVFGAAKVVEIPDVPPLSDELTTPILGPKSAKADPYAEPDPAPGVRPGSAAAAELDHDEDETSGTSAREDTGSVSKPSAKEGTPSKVHRSRIHPVWLITILGLLVLIVAGVVGTRIYLNNQFYLGEYQQRVALYQGVPEEIAGFSLGRVRESSGPKLADLPTFYADKVTSGDYRMGTLDEAQTALSELRAKAQLCIAQRQDPDVTLPGAEGCR
jgi:protein phosphatase